MDVSKNYQMNLSILVNWFVFLFRFTFMQGQLLIAHPLLSDGFFNRSVVYLTSHHDEGAIGFCLNFKTQFLLRDVRPQINNGNFPIYEGGPVAKNQLFFLHMLGHDVPDSYAVNNNVFVGGDFNELLHMIEHGKVKTNQVRFFAGYSGWSGGQLEQEIRNKHWLINEPSDANFMIDDTDELWGNKLSEIKDSYSIFANFGSDPSMN
jgi:putative transcriptional regulator